MSTEARRPAATAARRPLEPSRVHILDGFLAERQRTNRQRTLPHGFDQLQRSGALGNLRLAAGGDGHYQALADTSGATLPFLDSDVYKWLEAVGWELGRAADPGLAAAADQAIAVVAAAQRPDGYLNSYVQVVRGGTPHTDLAWGHEFYCIAHLIQAAVAWHRGLGDDRLLAIAVRAADRIDREFGPAGREGLDGHPGIEMALVELTRVTGERRYLALAARMLDLRGRGLLGQGRFGAAYWQDHAPVRDAPTVAGHAVRQLYLDCGAVDVAVELDDHALLAAVRHRWDDLVRTRTYLTGGMGSRHRDESFGDPYELRPTGPMPRPAPRSPASCWPGGCSWPRASRATPTPSSGPLQRRPVRDLPDRHPLLLRQPAAAPDPPRRGAGGARRARPLVPVRVLPAQPDAAAQLLGAVPGDQRRKRDPAPPVRHLRAPGRGRRGDRPAGRPDRLPLAGPGDGPCRRFPRPTVDAVPAGPGMVPVGGAQRARRGRAARPRPGHGRAVPALDGRGHGRPGARPAGPLGRARPAGRRRPRLRRRRPGLARLLRRVGRPATGGRAREAALGPRPGARDGSPARPRRGRRGDLGPGGRGPARAVGRRDPVLRLGQPGGRGDAGVDPR